MSLTEFSDQGETSPEYLPPPPEPALPVADRWAWGVCWLMFASTVLNYMDRQAISLVSGPVKLEFGLSNEDFGWVMAVFSMTYAISQVPAGFLVDRWDLKRTYAGAVAWWSMAGIASAFSPTLGFLMGCRAMLGVGESFNWPCALSVTGRILPPADRSLGNGIFNSGAAFGAVLTPLVVPLLTRWAGWRTSFVVIGALGFVWVAAWMVAMRDPRAARISGLAKRTGPPSDCEFSGGLGFEAKLAFHVVSALAFVIFASAYRFGMPAIWWGIATLTFGWLLAARVVSTESLAGNSWAASLGEVVRLRRFWVLVLVSVSINVCWHFLLSWMPTYLREDRGMSFLASGLWTAVPFLAADAGNLGGGGLSRMLAARGVSPVRARVLVMAGCTLLATSAAGVAVANQNAMVVALLALAAMGIAAFMANYFSFTQEVAPRHTGLVVGILGGVGNLLAAGILPLAGLIKDRTGSFAPIFVMVGVLPFVGLAALALAWGPEPSPGVEDAWKQKPG
ncbi:MAG: MFS transporter [Isosphaeraceae bacterium]